MKATHLNIAVPAELHREFKVECAKREKSMIDGITEAIRAWMRSRPDPRKKDVASA